MGRSGAPVHVAEVTCGADIAAIEAVTHELRKLLLFHFAFERSRLNARGGMTAHRHLRFRNCLSGASDLSSMDSAPRLFCQTNLTPPAIAHQVASTPVGGSSVKVGRFITVNRSRLGPDTIRRASSVQGPAFQWALAMPVWQAMARECLPCHRAHLQVAR